MRTLPDAREAEYAGSMDFRNALRTVLVLLVFTAALALSCRVSAASPQVLVTPERVLQGEPALVRVIGVPGLAGVSLMVRDVLVPLFMHDGVPTAIIGTDLRQAPGSYPIRAKSSNGTEVTTTLVVQERPRIVLDAPTGISDELGGDTAAGRAVFLTELAKENTLLARLRTGTKVFWTRPFRAPVPNPVVTDTYGYSRQTGVTEVAHRGTDYRAPAGTRVYAMNRGVVRLARYLPVYGNIAVVDHGLGLQTLYLHLSRIGVNEGELVLPGQLIGRSGQTGYAEGPHLHVSVKVSGMSVDPERFLALLGAGR